MPASLPTDTSEQARLSLEAAADGERRLLDAIAYGRVAPFLILWGGVWAAGFVGTYLRPESTAGVWSLVTALGWAGTAVLALRQRTAGHEKRFGLGARYTLSAFTLSSYAALWAFVLLSQHPNAPGIYAGTVTGFAYLFAGLWRGPLLIWLGLGVSALFLAGFLIAASWFLIYAGLVGGGGLLVAGLLLAQRDPG